MVRHCRASSPTSADTMLNIDSRIFRTLWPLLVKPGFLTNEYLAGRRVRYVTPFRLYFFLSIVAFLVIAVGLDATLDLSKDRSASTTSDDIERRRPPSEVQRAARRGARRARDGQGRAGMSRKAHARHRKSARTRSAHEADKRLRVSASRSTRPRPTGKPVPPDPSTRKGQRRFQLRDRRQALESEDHADPDRLAAALRQRQAQRARHAHGRQPAAHPQGSQTVPARRVQHVCRRCCSC